VVLFQQHPGYKSVRIVEGKGTDGSNVAFVDFGTVNEAMVARQVLNGHKVTKSHHLIVEYAKK